MNTRRLVYYLVPVLLVAGLLIGCTAPAATPKPAPATKSTPPASAAPSKPAATVAPSKPATTAAPSKPATTALPTKPAPSAGSVADFYKNNPLTVIVSSSPGGGIDYTGRLFASFWSDVSGGFAKVKNVPGGGGAVAFNQASQLPPDGLTIVGTSFGAHVTVPWLLKDPAVKYDPKKFVMIGGIIRDEGVFAVGGKSTYKSATDIPKTAALKLGVTDAASVLGLRSVVLFEALGLEKAKLVSGFKGNTEVALAASKGEIDGLVGGPGGVAQWIQRGFIKEPLVITQFERSKWWPNSPALSEVVKLSAENEKLLRIVFYLQPGSGYCFAVPGVAPEKVAFVRDAFKKMTELPGFKQMYALSWLVWDGPEFAEDIGKKFEGALNTSPEDMAKLKQLLEKYKAL